MDVKNRRETAEMLEEMKEEKKYIEEMTKRMETKGRELEEIMEKALRIKNDLNDKEEFEKISSEYVKKTEIIDVIDERNKEIIEEKIIMNKRGILEIIDEKEYTQLEEWTWKRCVEIIFDTNKDEWNKNTKFEEIMFGKKHLIFVIEDDQNNKFGYYFDIMIHSIDKYVKGNKSFLFSLKSNGRINGMMKFEEISGNGFYIHSNSNSKLFEINGGIDVYKEYKKNESTVYYYDYCFDYHGITKAFHPKLEKNGDRQYFTPKRITVIQMK